MRAVVVFSREDDFAAAGGRPEVVFCLFGSDVRVRLGGPVGVGCGRLKVIAELRYGEIEGV